MTDPFGGPPKPPPEPFTHFPIETDTPKARRLPPWAMSIVFGAAGVAALYFILQSQDPNRRREATAAIATASSPSASSAGGAPIRRGAFARSAARGVLGLGNDYATDEEAESAARDACGQPDCALVETFPTSCAAIAQGKALTRGGPERFAYVFGETSREAAEVAALKKCGKSCAIVVVSCPTPR
jgi:hypothetical protein